MRTNAVFYCVADARYFLGLVALLNSLRLHGHVETVRVLDRGLTHAQRERISEHVELIDAHDDVHAILSKTYAPLQHPAELMVLLDVDMIVTRSLAPLLDDAASGHIVAFADEIADRFHPEWRSILELPALRRRTYVNAGLFAFQRSLGLPLLERLHEVQPRIELRDSRFGGSTPDAPFFFPDQDVWNALLSAFVADDEISIYANRLAPFPPFRGVQLVDAQRVECRYADGEVPYLLHYIGPKPWLTVSAQSVFTRLLTRLLVGDDVAIRLDRRDLPHRLRPGAIGRSAAVAAEAPAWIAGQRGRLGVRRRASGALSKLRKSRYSGRR